MHPILFHIPAFHFGSRLFPGMDIYTYGVLAGFAFLAGLWVAVRRAQAAGLSPDRISDLCLLLVIAGVAGSRLLFVLEDWHDYTGNFWSIFNIREGGLSIDGGLLLAFIAGSWYVIRYKLPFWKTADVIAPGLALAMGIGRIGCFFNGCCYGIPTTLPWGVVFPGLGALPRHPTELYQMALNFLIAGIAAFGFKKAVPGTAFLWTCLLLGIERFFMEFIRADVTPFGIFTVAQWISLIIVAAATFFLVFRRPSYVAKMSS